MGDQAALAAFKRGVELLRKNYPADAFDHFQAAVRLEEQNPFYVSYLGLAVARAHRKWVAAIKLCQTAVAMKRNEPQLYMNLAEVYATGGSTENAVDTLETALKYCGPEPNLLKARNNLGCRRRPVLPFLERGHILNLGLGKIRYRVASRLRRSQPRYHNSDRTRLAS
jgi:Flp pilus assembly protein TadD